MSVFSRTASPVAARLAFLWNRGLELLLTQVPLSYPSACDACLAPQASLSLPGSPFDKRRGSQYSVTWARNDQRYGDRGPLMLRNAATEQDLPFADESVDGTPESEESGLAVPISSPHSRHSSYTSHSSRISYTSHGEGCTRLPSWTRDKGRRCLHEVRTPSLLVTSFLESLLIP